MSICRRAPSTSIDPTGANIPFPPKPIVPRVSTETRRPLRPSCRCSMALSPRLGLLALPLLLAQLHPPDLAGQRLRQVGHELDLARVGVGRVALAHVLL